MNLEEKSQKIDQMALDALLAEYQQLYEHSRHDNNIGATLQGILATASFLILYYAFRSDQLMGGSLLLAATTSILLYACYLLYFEQLRLVIETRFERIAEIEALLSDGIDNLRMDFVGNFGKRIEDRRRRELSGSGIGLAYIPKLLLYLSGKLSQRFFRIAFLFLLIALWAVRIACGGV